MKFVIALILFVSTASAQPRGIEIGWSKSKLDSVFKGVKTVISDKVNAYRGIEYNAVKGMLLVKHMNDTVKSWSYMFKENLAGNGISNVYQDLQNKYGVPGQLVNDNKKEAEWRLSNGCIISYNYTHKVASLICYKSSSATSNPKQ